MQHLAFNRMASTCKRCIQNLPNVNWAKYFDYHSAKILYATMHNKNTQTNSTYRKGELELCTQTAMGLTTVQTKVVNCNNVYKNYNM